MKTFARRLFKTGLVVQIFSVCVPFFATMAMASQNETDGHLLNEQETQNHLFVCDAGGAK
jgi:hypothetical protein